MIRSNLSLASSALFAFALACNTPAKEAHEGAAVAIPSASASAPASATAVAPASSPTKPGACTNDDDCRTFSSYCAEAPCACRVVANGDPDPKCLGDKASNVRCFADPCMGKAAGCQNGACALTARR